jgi:hypothetical protein
MLHARRIPGSEIVSVPPFEGSATTVSCTSIAMTLADLVRVLSRTDGVAVVDAALNAETGRSGRPAARRGAVAGLRGAIDGRARLAAADGRAQSPLETRIRLVASGAGMPPDVLQHPVRDRHGRLLGYADLAWLRTGRRMLVAETDGREWHDVPAALYHDRRRANDFAATGEVDMVASRGLTPSDRRTS